MARVRALVVGAASSTLEEVEFLVFSLAKEGVTMTMFEKHPLRWGFHLFVGVVLAVFLMASVFCSARASIDPSYCEEGGDIEDRLGILVVQVCHVQEDENGILHDQLGYTYSGDGDGWIVFVYNPFSTYFDDVIVRWDL